MFQGRSSLFRNLQNSIKATTEEENELSNLFNFCLTYCSCLKTLVLQCFSNINTASLYFSVFYLFNLLIIKLKTFSCSFKINF